MNYSVSFSVSITKKRNSGNAGEVPSERKWIAGRYDQPDGTAPPSSICVDNLTPE